MAKAAAPNDHDTAYWWNVPWSIATIEATPSGSEYESWWRKAPASGRRPSARWRRAYQSIASTRAPAKAAAPATTQRRSRVRSAGTTSSAARTRSETAYVSEAVRYSFREIITISRSAAARLRPVNMPVRPMRPARDSLPIQRAIGSAATDSTRNTASPAPPRNRIEFATYLPARPGSFGRK
jgi:hypothetical protein